MAALQDEESAPVAPKMPPPPAGPPGAASAGGASAAARQNLPADLARTRLPKVCTPHASLPDRHPVYAALDLGTNNCRLLLARPSRRGFYVVDAFSRIIRLGEGLARTDRLSEAAILRTIDALRVCARKIAYNGARRSRLVATEACRVAANAPEFLARVHRDTGLRIEILSPEAEAHLAVMGCASLIDVASRHVLVFDIGGGSSELIWLDMARRREPWRATFADRHEPHDCLEAWTSLPIGVVTLAEKFGGRNVRNDTFEAMVRFVLDRLEAFEAVHQFCRRIAREGVYLLGTSGTVTTVAGVHLGLRRYDRDRVDGCWLKTEDFTRITKRLLAMSYEERVAQPCIGRDRADLVLGGCAILEALLRVWPCDRMRVADRGLREGILTTLMSEDGVYSFRRRR